MDVEARTLEGAGRSAEARSTAWPFVTAGLLWAAAAAPANLGLRTWAMNFAYCWGPQAAVLLLLLAAFRRGAPIAGVALAMGVHFAAFDLWIRSLPPREALAWLYYLLSFPGALAGALVAAFLEWQRPGAAPLRAGARAAALTFAGIAVNHVATRFAAGGR